MALFQRAAFICVVVAVDGLKTSPGVAGDPVPPQYPVVNVHVPEPLAADGLAHELATHQQRLELLDALEARVVSTEDSVAKAVGALSAQVEKVASVFESL